MLEAVIDANAYIAAGHQSASGQLVLLVTVFGGLVLNRVPFLESEVFLVLSDLLCDDSGCAAPIVFERYSDLTDVRLIVHVVLVRADNVVAFRREFTEA